MYATLLSRTLTTSIVSMHVCCLFTIIHNYLPADNDKITLTNTMGHLMRLHSIILWFRKKFHHIGIDND
jgi:hypothetical protein